MGPDQPNEISEGRRNLLKAMATGAGVIASRVLLPALWSTPIIAAMEMPAHACTTGGGQTTIPCDDMGSNTPPSSNANLSWASSTGGLTVTITTPAALLSTPAPFQLIEVNGSNTSVVGQFLPTGHSLSNNFSVVLTRSSGTYQYHLQWTGGTSGTIQAKF